ncbi:MAG: exopolyphosphatase [Flavobacteriaceae bacterium]|jgi:exopolyphosphatase/guanosine-5'-triphosphate,3'-diphosphate pyrophosphatase|nr:exopolyphosphatase [Flavobacteriaceae bacterium]MBT3920080.1 exopolyphosphatase [Flavobacteriaceae bacterium]MBT6705500.1 exopolyphosphatase [Flavobacteriaceae bacterium]
MLNIKKYGAIDVGSNAIRLLIVTVIEQEGKEAKFKKTSLIRVPIRLGTDVFVEGKVSEASYLRMLDSFKAFQLLMKIHNVFKYRACATSAMREAKNGKTVVKRLLNATGIEINIINGNEEAKIIASTDLKTYLVHDKVFLYVDVGGGSTELTIYSEGKTVASKSFKMGTVRLINNLVDDKMWDQMKDWIKNNTQKYSHITLLGTGGNINSTYKYSGKKIGTPLNYKYLIAYFNKVKAFSYDDRIVELDMNPDRADVIIPALKIYIFAMKWSGAECIYVPKVGLSDGIIRSLYNEK